MPAIPPPDQGSSDILTSARADAVQSLRNAGGSNLEPLLKGGGSAAVPATAQATPPDDAYSAEPPPDAQDMVPPAANVPPPAATDMPPQQSHGNGNLWSLSNIHDFLRDEFAGTPKELGYGVMRGLARIGQGATTLVGGSAAAVADHVAGALLGTQGKAKVVTGAEDAVFNFKKNYVDPAIEAWTPDRQDVTGQGTGSGGAAQAIGGGAEMIPAMATGPVGLGALVTTTGVNSATEQLDQGHSLRASATIGAIDALGTAIQAMVPGHALPIVKRIMVQVPAGDVAALVQDYAKKKVLESAGDQKAADAIDPIANLGQDTLQNIVFGVLGGKGKKDVEPPAAAVDMPAGTPIPPAGPAPTTSRTQGALGTPNDTLNPPPPLVPGVTTPAAAPASTVPDTPTAEPMKDLRAQLRDMNDPATPRSGVFLSSANLANLTADTSKDAATIQRQMFQAEKTGRVIQLPNGSLIAKDRATAIKAQEALKNGVDPQIVLGQATGAGDGKQAADSVTVQGRTPDGAVAIEKGITPPEIPAAVADVKAQGKEPVVMSTVDALQRREAEIQAPPPEAQDMPPAKPPEAAAPPEADEGASAQRGIVKTGAGERAVIIHDATPDAEGKITVSPIDEEGEPGPQIKVPADALVSKTEKAAMEAPRDNGRPPLRQMAEDPAEAIFEEQARRDADAAEKNPDGKRPSLIQGRDFAEPIYEQHTREDVDRVEAIEAEKKAAPLLDQLKDASGDLTKQDQPKPGRKRSGSVEDRAGMIGNFARVLKSVAGTMEGEDAAHAVDMAKKYERVDLKSSESLAKNQGAGHTEFDIAKENLQNAARKLYEPEFNRPEPKLPVQEKLKARAAAKKAEPIAERKVAPKEKPVEKTKVIADVEDETKPKQLTKGEQLKLAAAGKRLIAADDEHLDARTSDIDKLIKEIYGHRLSDEERTAFIKSLTNERAERLRPKSRDEEIDEEFADNHRMEDGADDELEHRILGRDEVAPEVAKLHSDLEKGGFYAKLREGVTNKLQWQGRNVLDAMANHTSGDLKSFIQKISRAMPDQTIFRPVETVTSHRTGAEMPNRAGQYNSNYHMMQVRMRTAGDALTTHTILHEATHAATFHLMLGDPNHPYVKEAKNLYSIFVNRMRAQYGDVVDQHIKYLNKQGPKPEDYYQDMYGLMNPAEHMAEMAANGKYRAAIAKSERFKQSGEGYLGGVHNLAKATFNVLKKLLGMDTPGEGTLLHSSMRNLENVMEAQGQFLNERAENAVEDLHSLAMLDHDPKPLKDEPRLRGIMGSATADTARQFYRSVNSGALHAMRRLILANETHDQIVRSNAHWFGRDNEHNPLRQWDSTKQDAVQLQNKILERGRPAVIARQRLPKLESDKLGQIQVESQQWGFNPDKEKIDQTDVAKKGTNFDARFDDFRRRWLSLSPEAKNVFHMESEHNKWSARLMRKVGVDASLDTFSDKDVTAAQRSLLYSARTKGDFDALIGQGKQIDVGDRNEDLKKTLQELSAGNQVSDHYFHLGRRGDYVVEVNPEVEREFDTQSEAETHAAQIRETGPNAKAKVTNLGGKYQVSGKATYLSMHDSAFAAEREANRLRAQGHDVGPVTNKIEAESGGALSSATQNLVAEAQRKLERRGAGPETKALTDALRGTFVQMVADRSAYAASKLARKGFGGVKPEEMGRNFAAHVQSSAWNIANLGTTFRQGEALGKLRDAAKRPGADVSQTVVYKRGAVMREIGKRTAQEVSQYGLKNPVNAVTAKLGYMNYLASPAHTLVNGTQNFTTGLPVGIAKFGAAKTIGGFAKATRLIAGPTFRSAMKAFAPGEFNTEDMAGHVIKAVAADKELGKWGPALKQMLDRGALNSTFANEIGAQSQGGSHTVQRVFDMARIMPQMAEVYNRVSSALVALEATGGDIQKATDYVKEVHVDYTAANKTRMSKVLAKVPGANTVTMFRTYIQGMRHLLYSNIKNIVTAESKSRGEAAKTVAGLILAQSMVAGVVKGALIEPLRLAAYTYNQLFGSDDEYHDLDNTTRRFLADAMGRKAGDAVAGGLPHLLGFDLSSRMGLSDLFLHDPPDLLHADSKEMMQWVGEQLGGPVVQAVAENKEAFTKAMDRGDVFGAIASIIPLKLLRDISQAAEIATTGKRAGNGGQMTEASGLDAAYRAIGLKPADVEQAQEKQGAIVQYKGFVKDRKQRLLQAYGRAEDKGSVMDAIMDYNHANPANRIQPGDLQGIGRSAQRTTDDLQGGQERDPNISDLVDY